MRGINWGTGEFDAVKSINRFKFGEKRTQMTNKLIIENGGTKSIWVLMHGNGQMERVEQEGMHPLLSEAEALRLWCGAFREQVKGKPDQVFFYSTGTAVPEVNVRMAAILADVFGVPAERVEIAADVVASARATCQREPGISCILGTGSNACLYDGTAVVMKAGGLGYILGDEGSGAYMGKQMLVDYLRHQLPLDVRKLLESALQLDAAGIIQATYHKPFPNKYFASFAPFIVERREESYFRALIRRSVQDFLDTTVYSFPGHGELPVHFTGSIAWYLREQIAEVCEEGGLRTGLFQQNPVAGLLQYHQ